MTTSPDPLLMDITPDQYQSFRICAQAGISLVTKAVSPIVPGSDTDTASLHAAKLLLVNKYGFASDSASYIRFVFNNLSNNIWVTIQEPTDLIPAPNVKMSIDAITWSGVIHLLIDINVYASSIVSLLTPANDRIAVHRATLNDLNATMLTETGYQFESSEFREDIYSSNWLLDFTVANVFKTKYANILSFVTAQLLLEQPTVATVG